LAFLKDQDSLDDMQLTIVGSGHPEYEQSLHKLVDESNLEGRVFFWPRVPREEMPLLLRKFDVLVFPSLWDEPLARMMQEAMACGLLVVGTPTGGTPEILKDGETGLTFPPGDAKALASQLQRLLKDHELRDKLSHNARRIVESKFSLTRMVDEIEEHLEAVAEQRKREGGCQSVQEVDRIEATK
jgi:glycosyltransferase involved in cell wall biosynthesis